MHGVNIPTDKDTLGVATTHTTSSKTWYNVTTLEKVEVE